MEKTRDQSAWYVVHCKPLKEVQAASSLRELLGLRVYLPMVMQRFRGETQYSPFFPRYLFVQANLTEVAISAINATQGVVRLVTYGDMPQAVPVFIMNAIQDRLRQLDEAGGLPQHLYKPGQTIELRGGPLRGLQAVFVGPRAPSERVRILVEFLGELREVEIDANMLESDRPAQSSRRERRTRGRGRRIDQLA